MTMIEKVAEALFRADGGWSADARLDEAIADDAPAKPKFIKAARAAIEAMREPTEAMIAAGNIAAGLNQSDKHEIPHILAAVIDAALKET